MSSEREKYLPPVCYEGEDRRRCPLCGSPVIEGGTVGGRPVEAFCGQEAYYPVGRGCPWFYVGDPPMNFTRT
jgi:hypothetical protein